MWKNMQSNLTKVSKNAETFLNEMQGEKKDEYSLPFSYISKQRTGSSARKNIWLLSFFI